MAEKREDGGPAFPILNGNCNMPGGMSLRDWFAGQSVYVAYRNFADGERDRWEASDVAADAYGLADALLTERQK